MLLNLLGSLDGCTTLTHPLAPALSCDRQNGTSMQSHCRMGYNQQHAALAPSPMFPIRLVTRMFVCAVICAVAASQAICGQALPGFFSRSTAAPATTPAPPALPADPGRFRRPGAAVRGPLAASLRRPSAPAAPRADRRDAARFEDSRTTGAPGSDHGSDPTDTSRARRIPNPGVDDPLRQTRMGRGQIDRPGLQLDHGCDPLV